MAFISYNGKLLPDDQPIIAANHRGLRYGDGLFETIKFKNNELILLDEHLNRIWQGARLLQFDIPKLLSPASLTAQIRALIQKNQLREARVRVAWYRRSGGLYDAHDHRPDIVIEAWPLPVGHGQLQPNGLHLCVYRDARKTSDQFSPFKLNHFLPYLMGALYAKEKKCNDAIILNADGRICDSTIANIFIIQNGQIITPPLTEGCIAGIMRSTIIRELSSLGYPITEKALIPEDLANAQEVFLTNSIYNLRWVGQIEEHSYGHSLTTEIYSRLQQTRADIFC